MELKNPIQKRIEEGMSPLAAVLTDATCGDACWYAREEVCRCSCGGKNHGCMLVEGVEQPLRAAKIDGMRRTLKLVGTYAETYELAKKMNRTNGPYRSEDITCTEIVDGKDVKVLKKNFYNYWYRETDVQAPARIKPATPAQVQGWQELAIFRGEHSRPYLLWVKD